MGKRIGLVVAGVSAALLAIGGTALGAASSSASIPDSSGIIRGCYDSGGNVKVIDTSVTPSCPRGYSELDWNQTGPAGAQGPQGPAGATGAIGPQGAAGSDGTNGTNGTNGTSIVTSSGPPSGICNSGDTDVDLADGQVYTCTAAAWTDTGSSIEGPQGPQGQQGPAGPQGPAGGGIGSLSDLNGLTCTAADGSPGTVTLSSDSTGSTLELTCTPGPAFSCLHDNGASGQYTDCQDQLGTPGDASTYNLRMATEAAQSWMASFGPPGASLKPLLCIPSQSNLPLVFVVAVLDASGARIQNYAYTSFAAGLTGPSCDAITGPTRGRSEWT